MKSKSMIIAAIAALGLGGGHVVPANVAANAQQSRQLAAIKNGQTTRQIEADHFGGYASGILSALLRDNGTPPHVWGVSRACVRMMRKNRMRRAGVGGARQ